MQRARDETGASLVEYVLLIALIALACIAAVTFLGTSLGSDVSRSSSKVAEAGTP